MSLDLFLIDCCFSNPMYSFIGVSISCLDDDWIFVLCACIILYDSSVACQNIYIYMSFLSSSIWYFPLERYHCLQCKSRIKGACLSPLWHKRSDGIKAKKIVNCRNKGRKNTSLFFFEKEGFFLAHFFILRYNKLRLSFKLLVGGVR